MSDGPVRRRDLLTTAAFGAAGVGGLFALWPFVAALGPDAETLAKRIAVNIDDVGPGVTIAVGSEPVLIFRRSQDQLAALQGPPSDGDYRDRDSVQPWQPGWAANWHRSSKPEIMVCVPRCTFDPWVIVTMPSFLQNALMCPHCGARYDLSGRVFHGPARHNLFVPPHRYLDEHTIEFNESEVIQSFQQAMRAWRANPA